MQEKQIKELLQQYQTPFYVFDMDVLHQHIHYLQEKLGPRIQLCYAMKANPFIVKEVEAVSKLEVCSPGEYEICDALDIHPSSLVISGVYKTPEAIEKMITKGVETFTIESLSQLSLLDALSRKHQKTCHLLLRLTSGNQFGLAKEDVVSIIRDREMYPYLCIKGIQFFSGTQKTSIKRLTRELKMLDQLMIELSEDGFEVEELEYGPGFPVSYFMESKEFDEDMFLSEFSQVIEQLHYQGPIVLELGRSIAASCGTYFTQVVDSKKNDCGNYAIVDGGMHQFAYYGQMMAMKHPYYQLYPLRSHEEKETWNICGSLCTVNDLLVKQLPLHHLDIGDVFLFKNTGAYSMTEGISLFLSRDLPQVILYKNNQYESIRDHMDTYHLNTCERRE